MRAQFIERTLELVGEDGKVFKTYRFKLSWSAIARLCDRWECTMDQMQARIAQIVTTGKPSDIGDLFLASAAKTEPPFSEADLEQIFDHCAPGVIVEMISDLTSAATPEQQAHPTPAAAGKTKSRR